MTAAIQAGALSRSVPNWQAIDWASARCSVRRLQARIVKATQEQRWGKVRALQHLLTHSFSGKALAVKQVTENSGKRTPGVDRAVWNTPAKKEAAVCSLKQQGYQPFPLRRLYIPKSNGKMRPLGIPAMKDRAMQALYLLALDPIAESTADPNSYGFRRDRSTADAIAQCFITLGKRQSPQWVLEGDIKACFDQISHDWMLANIPMDKAILRKWLKAGFIDENTLHPTEAGTPQGGIVSPVAANLTLDGLEKVLRERFPQLGHGRSALVNMVRYADDFIVTGRSKELLESKVKPLVTEFLKARGLELSAEKTRITHIEEGFDFLGQNVRKYNGKLLITPSRKNVRAFLDKVRRLIKANKQATAGGLIALLNPVIRGWTITGTSQVRLCSPKWTRLSSTACGSGRVEGIVTSLRGGSTGSILNASTASDVSSAREAETNMENHESSGSFAPRQSRSYVTSRSGVMLTLMTLVGKPTSSVGLT